MSNRQVVVDGFEQKQTVICGLEGDDVCHELDVNSYRVESTDTSFYRILSIREEGWCQMFKHLGDDADNEHPSSHSESQDGDEENADGNFESNGNR